MKHDNPFVVLGYSLDQKDKEEGSCKDAQHHEASALVYQYFFKDLEVCEDVIVEKFFDCLLLEEVKEGDVLGYHQNVSRICWEYDSLEVWDIALDL